ncbi:hypothetical protein [Vibrio caribbeanicus]|uniref:hypothetical protein n=1 Tax=Vibrio caribbeanicus TaxID=701175 RepID=UPI00068C0DC4|nr:hypothetical protein [Vibrio caribbeanicus]
MEDLVLILNIAVVVSISIGGFLIRNYFPKYLSEKAKNLATKEDIGQITDQVESIKRQHAVELEKIKTELDVKGALRQSFQSKSLDALTAIDELLVEIHLYSWKQLAERSPNEHYVWSNVDTLVDNRHFHYYRVAIDKVKMVHGLYLTSAAQQALSDLSQSLGMLSSMELALSSEPDEAILESAVPGYSSAIESVEKCRKKLMHELGVQS